MVIKLDLMGFHGDFHGNSLEIHGISWWFPWESAVLHVVSAEFSNFTKKKWDNFRESHVPSGWWLTYPSEK